VYVPQNTAIIPQIRVAIMHGWHFCSVCVSADQHSSTLSVSSTLSDES